MHGRGSKGRKGGHDVKGGGGGWGKGRKDEIV